MSGHETGFDRLPQQSFDRALDEFANAILDARAEGELHAERRVRELARQLGVEFARALDARVASQRATLTNLGVGDAPDVTARVLASIYGTHASQEPRTMHAALATASTERQGGRERAAGDHRRRLVFSSTALAFVAGGLVTLVLVTAHLARFMPEPLVISHAHHQDEVHVRTDPDPWTGSGLDGARADALASSTARLVPKPSSRVTSLKAHGAPLALGSTDHYDSLPAPEEFALIASGQPAGFHVFEGAGPPALEQPLDDVRSMLASLEYAPPAHLAPVAPIGAFSTGERERRDRLRRVEHLFSWGMFPWHAGASPVEPDTGVDVSSQPR